MDHHLEKSMRIINDLVAFCHQEGAEEYDIKLRHRRGVTRFHISAPVPDMPQMDIIELSEELNLPRQHEIEQNYWELSGDSELSGELTLVGMMIDGAEVEYSEGLLTIDAWRKD